MPTEIKAKSGTQIRFFVSGSFSPADNGTNWTQGTPTDVALTLASVVIGAGRQSAKADLGSTWGRVHHLFGCVDYTGESPTSGATVDYYWAPSTSSTAGEGNVAGNSGSDAAAPNGAVPSGITLAEFLRQCIRIGSLDLSDDGSVQAGYVGSFEPPTRWGQLVVVNNGGDVFEADDVEAHQVLSPVIDEIQD